MKKKLLIIIPGSKTKSIPLFQPILNKFYSHFGVSTKNNDWPFKLKDTTDKYIDTVIFEWKGGVSKILSINPASKKLANFIKKYQDYDEIILFGKSLGGIVAEKAIKKINVYSNHDKYQKLANKLLYFGFGKRTLNNAKNISIDNLNHSNFNVNKPVKIHNKTINLFEFYSKIIEIN